MPDLVRLLQAQDLGYLRIVAELWGLDLKLREVRSGAESLAAVMLDARLINEITQALEPRAAQALRSLVQAGGRVPRAAFSRQFGEVRDMGAGRRDREQPYLHPVSAAEPLFYRALLGRAFFDTDNGPQEFAYIPQDLLQLMRDEAQPAAGVEPPGRAALPADHAHVRSSADRILDEATTLLAALRTNTPPPEDAVLRALLEAAGILRDGAPLAAKVKSFLEMPRAEALRLLVDSWRESEAFDELRLMPQLICEGTWANQPRATREFILGKLRAVPRGTWWSLPALVRHIKDQHADFQRPAGDYDSWFIKRAADGAYLRGFGSWDEVDGALIRFTITTVMYRLRLVDLAGPSPEAPPTAFRIVPASALRTIEENGKLHVSAQGRVAAGPRVARAARYQLARFCEWEPPQGNEHRYRLTPASLRRAATQGLKVEHLLALLARHADGGIPPALVKALKRWEANGVEARAESQVILRVSKPELLKQLKASRAARFLGEALGPTSVVVKSGAQDKVVAALAELGVLAQDESEPTAEHSDASGGGSARSKPGAKSSANLTRKK